jgi:Dockerin type I domain
MNNFNLVMKKQVPTCSQGKPALVYLPNVFSPTVDNHLPSISSPFQKERTSLFSRLSQAFPSFLNGKTLLLVLAFFVSFTTETFASHIRYGTISWRITGVNTVEYKVSYAERGSASIGSYTTLIGFNYGDGNSVTPSFLITSVNTAEDWFYGEATFTYTYASAGTYTAGMSTCCRIGSLANAPNGNFILSTSVNLSVSNASPISSFSPVICVPSGVAANTFYLTAVDPDGDPLTYSLGTTASGIPSFPSGLSVASNGLVTFNTVGLPSGTQYAVQILVSDGKTSIPVDFIINIAAVSSALPVFDAPTPANGSTINASVGVPLAITLKSSDPNSGDVVSLSVVGQPSGSTFSTALPASGNPSMTTLNWTPTAADAGGSYLVNVVASSATCESAITSFTINLNTCTPPTVSITGLNAAYCQSASAVTLTGTPAGGTFTIDGTSATQFIPSALSTGNHTVVYTYAGVGGCGNTDSKTVTINPSTTISTTTSPIICAGAASFTIPYTATTGSPTTYSIAGAGIVAVTNGTLPLSPIVVNLISGASGTSISYSLTVNNATGCSNITSGIVAVNPPLSMAAPFVGFISCQYGQTTISATATGGNGIFQYSLNGGTYQISNVFNVRAGTYTITAKDGNGCTVSTAIINVRDGAFPYQCPASITVNANQMVANDSVPLSVSGYPNINTQCFTPISTTVTDQVFDVICGVVSPQTTNFFPANSLAEAQKVIVRGFSAVNGVTTYNCFQTIYVRQYKMEDISFPNNVTLTCGNLRTDPTEAGIGAPSIAGTTLNATAQKGFTATYTDVRTATSTGFTIQRTWTVTRCASTEGIIRTFVQTITVPNCAAPSIAGSIGREDGTAVPATTVLFNSLTGRTDSITGANYSFANLLINSNVRVKPTRPNTDWTSGVTMLDVTLLSRHLLDINPLTSPYSIISADVNGDGAVDGVDMLLMQRLILHLIPAMPNNNSWRFILKNHVFRNPTNPFANDFPEILVVPNLTAALANSDFVAIKVGDLNQSAGTVTIRGSEKAFMVNTEDMVLEQGKTYQIPIQINPSVSSLQFTLNVDKTAAKINNIQSGNLPNFTDNNTGLFQKEGMITAAWYRKDGQSWGEPDNFTMMTVTLTPTKTTRLSEIMSINSAYTEGVAYDAKGNGLPVQLAFGNKVASSEKAVLLPNRPNPFSNQTTLSFTLPEASVAKLTVCDLLGKVVMTSEKQFAKGLNEVVFDAASTPSLSSGIFVVRLQTATGVAEQKIVLQR